MSELLLVLGCGQYFLWRKGQLLLSSTRLFFMTPLYKMWFRQCRIKTIWVDNRLKSVVEVTREVEPINCPDGLSCVVVHDPGVYCVNWSNSLFLSKDADLLAERRLRWWLGRFLSRAGRFWPVNLGAFYFGFITFCGNDEFPYQLSPSARFKPTLCWSDARSIDVTLLPKCDAKRAVRANKHLCSDQPGRL